MKGFISDRALFPGRQWDDATKTWVVPDVLIEDLRKQTEAQGWKVLDGEDEQLEAEIATIERVQQQVIWHAVEIAIRQE